MRWILIAGLSGIMVSSAARAQTAPNSTGQAPPAAGEQRVKIAPGSVIPVVLARSLDAKKLKPGDPVEAKVTQDLRANDGEVILAKDAKVKGHVTAVQPRSKEQKESQITVVFDSATMKEGDTSLPMSIQAIVFPSANEGGGGGGLSSGAGGNMANDTTRGGRPTGMSMPPPGGGDGAPQPGASMPQVTAQTQGVINNPNLKLAGGAQGSVISSEKNNVKLEDGTLMLLRVNQ